MKELLQSKFLSFFNPAIDYIDSGKLFRQPFSWLYLIIAVLNAIIPFYILYQAIDANIFSAPTKFVFAFIFVFLLLLFAAWFSVQFWLNRSVKISEVTAQGAEFVATPVFSTLIQNFGEWLGVYFAGVGFGGTLIFMLFAASDISGILPMGGDLGDGWLALVTYPMGGFLIVVFSRFVAEMFRAFTSIANNTAKK